MTKQEFLAMSLPYGLKVYDCIGKSIELVEYSKGCPKCVCEAIGQVKNEDKCVNVFQAAYDKQLKPILHPIFNLTEEIEHEGEKFVPIIKLASYPETELIKLGYEHKNYYASFGYGVQSIRFYVPSNVDDMNLYTAQKLVEWHFDIAGLIEKGEAIDINTLSENPYSKMIMSE